MRTGILVFGLAISMMVSCSSSKKEQQEVVQADEQDNAEELENNENMEENYTEESTSPGIATGDGTPAERIVVFVLQDETPIYSEASAESTPVASLMQGDPVVVFVSDPEWGQITSDRYIQLSMTSKTVVPRSKGYNKWIAQ